VITNRTLSRTISCWTHTQLWFLPPCHAYQPLLFYLFIFYFPESHYHIQYYSTAAIKG
jgi:hypothetical protein